MPLPHGAALKKKPFHQERLGSPFCLSHSAPPNAESLGFPGLGHSSRPVQSQVQPSRVLVCRFNRSPLTVRFCMERCGAPLRSGVGRSRTGCQLRQWRPLPGVPRLFYIWEFPRYVGNKDPSGNAALTPSLHIDRELQSWVVLTAPS